MALPDTTGDVSGKTPAVSAMRADGSPLPEDADFVIVDHNPGKGNVTGGNSIDSDQPSMFVANMDTARKVMG